MNPMNAVILVILMLSVILLTVNGFSIYLFYRLKTLVLITSEEVDDLVTGESVGHLLTKYLFGQLMAGRFYRGANVVALGDPESSPVIRAVKYSAEYARIMLLAEYVRNVPLNVVPHLI